jgi:sec-independent protein translocase protein TatA
MPFNLGVTELVVIMVILLLVFGAKRLPEIGSSMGKGIREFKKSIREVKGSIEEDDDAPASPRQLDAPGEQPSGGEPKKLSE